MKPQTDKTVLQILGSGTILSGTERQCAAYLFAVNQRKALLDAGPDVVRQLKKSGHNPLQITEIFLSHFHEDHTAGLFPFLLWRFLLKAPSNKQLKIYGPAPIKRWFAERASWQGAWLDQARPQVIESGGDSILWAGLKVRSRSTPHTKESVAWRFGDLLFYGGDTDWSDELAGFARDCRCGLVECSLPDDLKMTGHLTTSECARLAAKARFKRLVPTHFYPQNERQDLKRLIQRRFNGEVTVARDLLTVKI